MTDQAQQVRVLVVDDETSIRDIVRSFLEREGMLVSEAIDGPSAVDAARASQPEVMVLDIMLPGFDGLEVLRQVRTFADPYVLMLTAKNEELDRIVGLTVGADDYMTKPFSPRELVARIRALLRRGRPIAALGSEDRVRRFGKLGIDLPARTVTVDDRPVELTAIEFDLLAALARDPGIVITRQQLLDDVWGADFFGDDHVLEVHFGNLRRKLAAIDPSVAPIETVRGVGYRFAGDDR